jgi:hypothetical protein
LIWYHSIISPLIQCLELKSSQNDFQLKVINFFTNLIGQLCPLFPSLRESEILVELEKITKKILKARGYSGPAFRLHALLVSFSNHKKIKININTYPKNYLLDSRLTRDTSPFILQAALQLLSGTSFKSDALFSSNMFFSFTIFI